MDVLDFMSLMTKHVLTTYPIGEEFSSMPVPKGGVAKAVLDTGLPTGTAQWWLKFFYHARTNFWQIKNFGMQEFYM